MRFLATAFFALASAFAPLALAQDAPDRAGRIAFIEGSVSVYQDPDMGWDRAYVNLPITSENSVWTDRGARAEVRVSGTALRLDELTQLDIATLDSDEMDAQIERGTVAIRVRSRFKDERLRFSTPHARFVILADGRYRIDVDAERDESRLTVFSGDARMVSRGGRVRVAAGQTVVVWGYPSPSYALERASSDGFDRWTLARDEQWRVSRSTRYVSSYMTGYEDLDRYGEWVEEPQYGALWFPTRVSSDWAPYRHGHWSYVRPWGWTWVDDAPWGYAPFHYGRWVQVRDRWAWYPGQRVERPAWAPALVAFIGGSNLNLGVTSGRSSPAVGWYPLSPWERYEPWYRTNTAYANRLNVNVVSFDRAPRTWQSSGDWRQRNRDVGTTVVQRDVIVNRQPVANAMVRVAPEAVRTQTVVAPTQVQQVLPQREEFVRRRGERAQAAPAAAPPPPPRQATVSGAPVAGAPAAQPGNAMVRPDFSRRAQRAEPAPAPANTAPPARAQRDVPTAQEAAANPQARAAREAQIREDLRRSNELRQQQQQQQQQQERFAREAKEQQERAIREQQQQQERAAREAQQQQERAAREAQQRGQAQQQERFAREAKEQQERAIREQQQQQQRAAREAQQQQERAAKEAQERAQQAQQAQQRDAQQRAARDAQQQQERAARDAQQQQERAAREAQQQQERAAQQQQQQQQERLQREAKEQQERAVREQQQQQRAAREAQQQQERAAREAQQRAQQAQQPQPAAPAQAQQPAAAPAQPANAQGRGERGKGRDRDKEEKEKEKEEKEKEEKEKGKGKR